MTDGPTPASDPAPEEAPTAEHRTPLQKVLRVLVGTEHVVARAAANLAAVTALVAFAVHQLGGGGPGPATLEASFLETKVQPDVLLEQYERESQPVNADYLPQSTSTAGGTRVDISLVAFTPTATTATSTPVGPAGAEAVSNPEREREESEKLAQEAKLKQAKAHSEEEKQREEAQQKEAKAHEEKRNEETPREAHTTEREHERLQNAGELRQQAKTESEDAHLKASEAKKIEQEEAHHPSGAPQPLPAAPLHRERDAEVAVGVSPPQAEVEAVVSKSGVALPYMCRQSCAISPAIGKALSEYAANSDEAARQLASMFQDSRQGVFDHKRQPLGVTVNYAIDFVGYEDRLLVVSWSLCSAPTGRPLPREWWRNIVAEQIKPTSNKAKIPGSFWAPVPPARGHYYFRLRIFDRGSEVAYVRTPEFR
jgi:hypothetical protein